MIYVYVCAGVLLAFLTFKNYSLRHELEALQKANTQLINANNENINSLIKIKKDYKLKARVLKSSYEEKERLGRDLEAKLKELRISKGRSCVELYNAVILP